MSYLSDRDFGLSLHSLNGPAAIVSNVITRTGSDSEDWYINGKCLPDFGKLLAGSNVEEELVSYVLAHPELRQEVLSYLKEKMPDSTGPETGSEPASGWYSKLFSAMRSADLLCYDIPDDSLGLTNRTNQDSIWIRRDEYASASNGYLWNNIYIHR